MYEYQVQVTNVVDGDTVDCIIDLGFHVTIKERLRLSGINAPEPRGESRTRGVAATNYLIHMIDDAQEQGPMFVRTEQDKQGNFGRFLATLFSHHGENLNERMIDGGHAIRYDKR